MPITRRRRANPPDQPEGNNHLADQAENAAEMLAAEQQPALTTEPESEAAALVVPEPEPEADAAPYQSMLPPAANGDRSNGEQSGPGPHQPHSIESGRRTARGELFRRPPVPPTTQAQAQTPAAQPPAPAPLQPPSHEIILPLGKRPGDIHGDPLHLAYNPGYTGADEMRAQLLHKLVQESKAGGRARCWSCGAVSIVYDRWNTRSKTFGEIGVAICEICGVWSVM